MEEQPGFLNRSPDANRFQARSRHLWRACGLALGSALVLVSCAGTRSSSSSTSPAPDSATGTGDTRPWTGGSVRFTGFSEAALSDFLVVSENHDLLLPARNALFPEVDGFWWRHERTRWFKIPNHCTCDIRPDPDGPFPSSFLVDSDCHALAAAVQRARGRPDQPGFQPDHGLTSHPTNYPFREPNH